MSAAVVSVMTSCGGKQNTCCQQDQCGDPEHFFHHLFSLILLEFFIPSLRNGLGTFCRGTACEIDDLRLFFLGENA